MRDILEEDLGHQRYHISPEDHIHLKNVISEEDNRGYSMHYGYPHPDDYTRRMNDVLGEDRRFMDASIPSDEKRKLVEKRASIQDQTAMAKKPQRKK